MIEIIFGANTFELDESKNDNSLPLFIKGKSVNAGLIKSKNFYLPDEELENIATSLKTGLDGSGAYILKDHGYKSALSAKSVDLLVGKVTEAIKSGRDVLYKGRIEDEDLATKMRKGLVSASSVSLNVKNALCSICGREYGHPDCAHLLGKEYPEEGLFGDFKKYQSDFENKPVAAIVGRGIGASEQSIVLFPAVKGASAFPMFDFSDTTEQFVYEVEQMKQLSKFNDAELFERSNEIITELDKIIESEKSKFTLENIKEYLEGTEYILLKKDDLKAIRTSLKIFELQDWCRNHGIAYDDNLIDLNEKGRQALLNVVEQTKSKRVGVAAEIDGDGFLTADERKKESIRERIFHERWDNQKILETRERKAKEVSDFE